MVLIMELKMAILENDVKKAEEMIKMELENNPLDIQWWIKLCLTELQFPFEDYNSALSCIEEIKKIDYSNIEGLVLETAIKWHSFGFIEDELLKRLSYVDIIDNNIMSIVYYLQSLYYRYKKDQKNEELLLNQSVTLCNKFVYPYKALGNIALSQSYVEDSKLLFMKGLNNVEKVYDEDEFFDFTDINIYISEFITGTYISRANYENLIELTV